MHKLRVQSGWNAVSVVRVAQEGYTDTESPSGQRVSELNEHLRSTLTHKLRVKVPPTESVSTKP